MDRPKSTSPRLETYPEYEDFLFVVDDDDHYRNMLHSPEPCSPNIDAKAVIAALASVIAREEISTVAIAKTVAGAAKALSPRLMGSVQGLATGLAIAGGVAVYQSLKGKSPSEIIKSLSPHQQKQLLQQLKKRVKALSVKNLAKDILNKSEVREIALSVLSNFLTNKFGLQLTKIN